MLALVNVTTGKVYTCGSPMPNGTNKFTINYPRGTNTVFSCQPDGSVQTRPSGSSGSFETYGVTGDLAVFNNFNGIFNIFRIVDTSSVE